jgi:succinyl-diaminopimelate desuccinylase
MPDSEITRSTVALLTDLVRTPSRAGIDPYEPVLDTVAAWLSERRLPHRFLVGERGVRVGIWGHITGGRAGPNYLLNATVDTAPFADEDRWTHSPLSAEQTGGWLWGRGSADSKAGVAIFCHVLALLLPQVTRWSGSLAYVFDAGEHTGEFLGIRRFMEAHGEAMPLDGAMIGYPGNDRIAIGGRGFARARLRVFGRAAHTGSATTRGTSAVRRAAQLIEAVEDAQRPRPDQSGFPLPPRISVTAVEGGDGFSVVPDLCMLNVDARLTPQFGFDSARAVLASLVRDLDRRAPAIRPTETTWSEGWPAYQLDTGLPFVAALREAARSVLGHDVPVGVVGPSSVANYLSTRGVPATNGFGVTYENIHATNERIALDSLEPVTEVYCRTLRSLLQV